MVDRASRTRTHPREDLDRALTDLLGELYHLLARRFASMPVCGPDAMLLRDDRAETGALTHQDWDRIDGMLHASGSRFE